ncbi:ATP-grasp domain-containing protein [Ectothiorhodospira shaposhnikovii]|uniref:ATP-grasp domain-containing protein n=1 Tax=Ectothiorhodospira shaposhnikovii TaxID=1054 RepID=UPI001EE8CD1C|nr:hypothetical protein [Ectothiorhodospira shaposhnikovii]MCG5512748.1 hypothetical protein [Ectothiorhodospira shaposhnikovii]
MKVVIHRDSDRKTHSSSWSLSWEAHCKEQGISYKILDVFEPGSFRTIMDHDALLMHFSNYSVRDMLHARSILYGAKQRGVRIFPDFFDSWHFDDKIAQSYLLEAAGASIPRWNIFYRKSDWQYWVSQNSEWPVVAKLRTGSGAHNVKLIHDRGSAIKYGNKMFSRGFKPNPSVLFKSASNIRSVKSSEMFFQRARRVPEFFRTWLAAREFPNEKGYVYVQEFIPNAGFDLRVVVVNGKLGYCARRVRHGDFRASGGGDIFYDHSLIDHDLRNQLFDVSDRLQSVCMGFDIVIDKSSNKSKIIEMSYGFAEGAKKAGVWWKRNGELVEGHLDAPAEILEFIISY